MNGKKLAVINAVSLSGGGGRVFVNSLVDYIDPAKFIVIAGEWIEEDFEEVPSHVKVMKVKGMNAVYRRLAEGREIRKLARASGVKVAVHMGNLMNGGKGMRNILYVHNALPFSNEFFEVLRKRGAGFLIPYFYLQRKMIIQAVRRATLVITPTRVMADHIREMVNEKMWSKIRVMPFGLDKARLRRPLPPDEAVTRVLEESEGFIRILHVGNFSYYKNFGLLIKAADVLRRLMGGENFRIIITASLIPGIRQHLYRADRECRLMEELGVKHLFLSTGPIHHRVIPHLYMNSDVFVWMSFTESYGFPLLESAFFGLPAAVSDIPVNREVRPDAVFFSPYSSEDFARAIYRALEMGEKPSLEIQDVKVHIRTLESVIEELS